MPQAESVTQKHIMNAHRVLMTCNHMNYVVFPPSKLIVSLCVQAYTTDIGAAVAKDSMAKVVCQLLNG